MLLGRTANGLYWMNRYIERTENMARLLDAGLRMALTRSASASEEWSSVLLSAGADEAFFERHQEVAAATVSDFLLRDTDQPVERNARDGGGPQQCAHGAYGAHPRDLGEHQRGVDGDEADPGIRRRPARFADRARRHQTRDRADPRLLLRHHAAQRDLRFLACSAPSSNGPTTPRASSTSNITCCCRRSPGSARRSTTTSGKSILRSVAAHRSYRWVYEADYRPTNIADYLILNGRMPRSLAFCYRFIAEHLEFLAQAYGCRHRCHETAAKTHAKLLGGSIKDIFDAGLHEFLSQFIRDNNRVGEEIAEDFRFH